MIFQPQPNPVETKLQKMSLEEKVSQLMFVGKPGNDRNFGGLIVNQPFDFTQGRQLTATGSGVFPFIGIDQEGGVVCRLPWLDCTGQREIKSTSEAADLASKRAKELKSLGFNVVFAPVLDIAESETDFIWSRSFSDNVGDLGAAMIEGFNRQGIIACPKHFPGHGGTNMDSHYQLPTVECDENCLREKIRPFKKAIEAGVSMIMVGHITVNNLTMKQLKHETIDSPPASLSKYWITDILKKQLKFNGVVITDDLNMGGIRAYQPDTGEAAVQAILAGADMVMVIGEPLIQEQVYQRLLQAVNNGEISKIRIDESLRRILKLKEEYNLLTNNSNF